MAFVLSDRIKETTTTTGTGTYTLGGAVSGFETFTANLSNGDTTYYCCTDGTDFEVGLGTFASSGTTLARTTIISSSNSNNAVNWSSGSRDIFCTLPGSKAVFKDGSDNINGTFVGNITGNASGTAATVTGASQSNITSVGTLTGLTTSGTINLSQTSGTAIKTTGSLSSADLGIIRASASSSSDTHGFTIKYMGSRTGNNNSYSLFMDNQTGTDVEAMTVLQDGKIGINNTSPSDTLDVGGDATITGDLTIVSTDSGASEDPNLVLYRNSSSPADDDNIGTLQFKGRNDNSQDVVYGEIQSIIQDASDGTEDSSLSLQVRRGGSATTFVNLSGESGRVNIQRDLFISTGFDITFEGDTADSFETVLKVADPTADRTVTLPDATGTVTLLTATQTLTNKTLTSPTINGFSGTGDASITGDLELLSTDAGASAGPTLSLYRNSASPASSDDIGQIQWFAENDAGEKVEYARIDVRNSGVTDGAEYGQMDFMVLHNGGEMVGLRLSFNLVQFYRDLYIGAAYKIQFEGDAYNDFETSLTVAGPTADRTITLPDASGTVFTSGNPNDITDIGIQAFDVVLGTGSDLRFEGATSNDNETTLTVVDPTSDRTVTLPDATGTVLTTGNSDTPTTTTSSSDADFVLVDDGGTMKKITPSNLGITSGGASKGFAVAMAIAL